MHAPASHPWLHNITQLTSLPHARPKMMNDELLYLRKHGLNSDSIMKQEEKASHFLSL